MACASTVSTSGFLCHMRISRDKVTLIVNFRPEARGGSVERFQAVWKGFQHNLNIIFHKEEGPMLTILVKHILS